MTALVDIRSKKVSIQSFFWPDDCSRAAFIVAVPSVNRPSGTEWTLIENFNTEHIG
ncbi:hypothetical protein Bpfe_027339, partial [Biomphalaria pfeifferi]